MSKNKSDKSVITSSINILTQNVDTTSKAVSITNDTQPFEQKNMPKGFKGRKGSSN